MSQIYILNVKLINNYENIFGLYLIFNWFSFGFLGFPLLMSVFAIWSLNGLQWSNENQLQLVFIWSFGHLLRNFWVTFFRSVHERIQQENMKVYFEKANKRNMRKMKFCLYFNRFIYPIFYILFIVLFWMVGLVNYSK